MNEKYTENKGCAGLLRNPAHPLFSGFFHHQCVSHNEYTFWKNMYSTTEANISIFTQSRRVVKKKG